MEEAYEQFVADETTAESIQYPSHSSKPEPPPLEEEIGAEAMQTFLKDMKKYNTPPRKPLPQKKANPAPKQVSKQKSIGNLGVWKIGLLAGGLLLAFLGVLKFFRGSVKEAAKVIDPVVERALPMVVE